MPSPDPAVAVEGLSRRYGERNALADVSFSVAPGESLAVFGANGAGKTTLLRILATLLRPHAGSVSVFGHSLPDDGWAARGHLGLLTHEPLLYGDLTVRENLVYHARLHGLDGDRVEVLMSQTGLERRAGDPAAALSRGMRQRVSICRVALHAPALLLLDEPWANLDPGAVAAVEPLIGRGSGAARVIVSHDVDLALREADRVLGLRDGQVEFLDAAGQIDTATVGRLYA